MSRVAVVGAGGAVGQEMLQLLEQASLDEPPLLYGSERSRGSEIEFCGNPLPVHVLGDEAAPEATEYQFTHPLPAGPGVQTATLGNGQALEGNGNTTKNKKRTARALFWTDGPTE